MTKIQPVNGHALIKLEKDTEEKKVGGIIIPKTAEEKLNQGIIAGLAAGATDELAVGDRVIYKEFSGTRIKHEGEEYLIIPVDDILAKFVEVDEI
ncbi:molecular chaperone GroES [Thermoanaerobacter kivui]|uniref:10 kDa chaperonin n=1 Tax=Thermoanaerobacter kivui TaxID=2325 RepID=A0A097AUN2_THEKI|nr:co-chaperone GroES [Thermoanaerobacter kivui]AIS53505.1 molecular chaperone GroES [Thermoanaerobacter kivui]